jgi:hypothetical protein
MFEKTSRLAEKLAAGVSRRGFLGSLGSWAAAAAMGVAGVLAGAGTARATPGFVCCVYPGSNGTCTKCISSGSTCPAVCGHVSLDYSFEASHCTQCQRRAGDGCGNC